MLYSSSEKKDDMKIIRSCAAKVSPGTVVSRYMSCACRKINVWFHFFMGNFGKRNGHKGNGTLLKSYASLDGGQTIHKKVNNLPFCS